MVTPFQGIGGTSLQGSVTYVLSICVTDVLRRFCYLCPGVVQLSNSMLSKRSLWGDTDEPQLHHHHALNLAHIGCRQPPYAGHQPFLADRRQLIGHRLALPAIHTHQSLTRVHPINAGRQGDHLQTIEIEIECVIAKNHGRPFLPHLPPDRWLEAPPPHLTPPHRSGLGSWLRPTPGPRPRALHPEPSPCMRPPDQRPARAGAPNPR